MNSLLIFATFEEAEASIDLLAARPSRHCQWLYEYDKGFLLITGIGSFAVVLSQTLIPYQVGRICHLGLAGALKPTLEIGKVYTVSSTSKLVWHPRGHEAARRSAIFDLCSKLPLTTDGVSLVSSDMPIYDSKELSFDLVDMEGYAIAFFARAQNRPCVMYKVVSDFCDSKSSGLIKQNMRRYSETMAQLLEKEKI